MSRPLTVVVGEDQALVREGVVRMLERAGLTVTGVAADATELVRLTRAHRPDVVITDIRMPPLHADDGLRAAMEIRAAEPAIGVIVLSQYLEDIPPVSPRASGPPPCPPSSGHRRLGPWRLLPRPHAHRVPDGVRGRDGRGGRRISTAARGLRTC